MKNWKLWLGIVISIVSLAYFCSGIDAGELWAAMKAANYLYIIPAILLLYAGIYIRGIRWQLFFKGIRRVPYNRLFAIEMVGFMGNSIYPLRAGEIMRAYLLGRREGVGASASLATIALERLFDLVAVIGALVLVLVLPPFKEAPGEENGILSIKTLQNSGYIAGIGFFVMLVALILMVYRPRMCESILGTILKIVPEKIGHRIFDLYKSFVAGLSVLRDGGAVILALSYTLVIWFTIVLSELMVIRAFGFTEIGFIGALFLMTVLALAVSAPQGPGYIGVFQIVVAKAVLLLGVSSTASANAFALVLWFVQMIPIIIAGWLCLAWLGLSLGQLKKEAETAGSPPPSPDPDAALDASASGATSNPEKPGNSAT
jgi:uncharacterized protein (TIRG00374 family)